MPRKRGEHYQPQETKRKIIEFVLDYPNGIEEPTLRDYLRNSLNISEQKSIKLHLENLRKRGCLEKIKNSGFANIWTIKTADNIRSIISFLGEPFLPILQNKSLINTIITSLFFNMDKMKDPEYRKVHVWFFGDMPTKFNFILRYSPTFFNYVLRCETTGNLYDDAVRLFHADTGFSISNNGYLLIDKATPDYKERLELLRKIQKPDMFALDDLIKHCLKHDVLLGCATEQGKERLKQILISEHEAKKYLDNFNKQLEKMLEQGATEEEIGVWIEKEGKKMREEREKLLQEEYGFEY